MFCPFLGWNLSSLSNFIHESWGNRRAKPWRCWCIKGTESVILPCPSVSWLTNNAFRLKIYWQWTYFGRKKLLLCWVSESWFFTIGPWQVSFTTIMKTCDVNNMAERFFNKGCAYLFLRLGILYSKVPGRVKSKGTSMQKIIKDLTLVQTATSSLQMTSPLLLWLWVLM